jgi:tocopherol cyclase
MKIYHPEVFQGNLRKKNYFEGWYFKNVTHDQSQTIAVIPGISLANNDPHAFIQIASKFSDLTDYIRYPLDQFSWDKNKLFVQVGNSTFTGKGMSLDIRDEKVDLRGKIEFIDPVSYPGSLFSPGIMGWYSFVPFMECNHGIVSVNHELKGELSLNGNTLDFTGGKGYIEKDWGVSFPEAWIWVQSNNFNEYDTSFCFSIAKIPWMGRFFIGLIAFLYTGGKFYLFSTYNKSVITGITHSGEELDISIKSKTNLLKIRVIKNSFTDLTAPVSGEMSRRIKESIDSEVFLQLFDNKDNILYEGNGKNVGLEIIEKIFDYL